MIIIFVILLSVTVVIHFWLGIFDYNKKIKIINNNEWKNGWHYALEKLWVRLIVVCGLGLVGGLFMDTTFHDSSFDRVHNIGLISDRESLIVVASTLLIVCTLFFVSNSIARILSKKSTENTESGNVHHDSDILSKSADQYLEEQSKQCTSCAEFIKVKAKRCRFCGEQFEQADIDEQIAKCLKNRSEEIVRVGIIDKQNKTPLWIKTCPNCAGETIRATVEDGGDGDWCPKCNKSIQRMKNKI